MQLIFRLRSNWLAGILILLSLIVCMANYTPSTFLSGWDTLHPEFNISLAFERMFRGVWRVDQGLGAVAIQSHIAELPRVLILWFASFLFPLSSLRYLTFFSMLCLGPLGIYVLTHNILSNHHYRNDKVRLPSFLAGLVYLFNLGTVQHFIVPLEMFAIHYGLLPWILFLILSILEQPTKRRIIVFAILSFLASAQSHTATLFYAYAASIFLLLAGWCFGKKFSRSCIKRSIGILAIILTTNAYWLLPNIYATVTHGQEIRESKVNQLFSPEAFAKNQAFGTLPHAALLKNFLFNWTVYDYTKNGHVDMMAVWKEHLANPLVPTIGYGVFALSLFGIGRSIKTKNRRGIALLPMWGIGLFMLLSGTPPFPLIFEKIQVLFPIAGEALRFPFTKFSIVYMVPFSVFAGIGIGTLISFLPHAFVRMIVTFQLATLLCFYGAPMITGNLIHPAMKITIPTRYFDMFCWFSSQPINHRVAILPIHSFWNWTYYDWGYQGAGFLQFGIPQPILDRDYDRWNPYNEQYAREMAYAVYSRSPETIAHVAKKYAIRYVLFDASMIAPGENKNVTLEWELPSLLHRAGFVQIKSFGDELSVWDTKQEFSSQDMIPVSSVSAFDQTGLPYDSTFTSFGPYISKSIPPTTGIAPKRLEKLSITSPAEPLLELFPERVIGKDPVSYPFPTLSHSQAYVVEIASINRSGFPLELCLLNDLSQRCETFTRASAGNYTKTDVFLLPKYEDYATGWTLNMKSPTIAGSTGDNTLVSIVIKPIIWPLPTATLQEKTSVLTNWQAYESGWKAYDVAGCKAGILCRAFPFIFGKAIGAHVLVNNWANGFLLGPNTSEFGTDKRELSASTIERSIVIFFLPQTLEWIGFLLGGGVLIALVYLHFFQKKGRIDTV